MAKLSGPCVLCEESSSSKTFFELERLRTRNSKILFTYKLFEVTGLQIRDGEGASKKEICRLCHDFVQEIDSIESNLNTKKESFSKRVGATKKQSVAKTPSKTATPLKKNTPAKATGPASPSPRTTPVVAKKSKPMPLSKKRDSGIHDDTPVQSPSVTASDPAPSCYIKTDPHGQEEANDERGERRRSLSESRDSTPAGPSSSKRRRSVPGGETSRSRSKTPVRTPKTPQKPLPPPSKSDYGPFVSTDEMPIMKSIYKENPELNFIVTRMTERIIDRVIGKDKDNLADNVKDLNLKDRNAENPVTGPEWATILRLILTEATNDPKHTTLFQDKVFVKAFQAETRINLVNKFPDFAYKGCLGYYRDDSSKTWNNEKVFENLRSKLNITVNQVRKMAGKE